MHKTLSRHIKPTSPRKGEPIRKMDEDYESEKQLQLYNIDSKLDKEQVKDVVERDGDEALDFVHYKSEFERFIEISKYFSSPLHKTASYLSENCLVSYPKSHAIEYKRGGVTTGHIIFRNQILEPIYVKLFKLVPDLEEIKFINLSMSRCKRVPPGLSFTLGFVYDDVNEREATNSTMIFVASRKTTTPCYQICEIRLVISPKKIRIE